MTPEQRDQEAPCKELAVDSTDVWADMETAPSAHSCLTVSWDSHCVIGDRSSLHSVRVKNRAGLVWQYIYHFSKRGSVKEEE